MQDVWNYVLIGVVVLLLIALPIMMNARNKRESQKVQEQTNSLKVGDKIMTTSGVYGTIVELKFDDVQKIVVIETGGKNKSYLSLDAYAIYTIFKSDEEIAREAEEAARLANEIKDASVEDKTMSTTDEAVADMLKPKKEKTASKKTNKKK